MDKVKSWLTTLLGEDNGNEVCIAKLLALFAFISYIGYAAYGLVQGHFALNDFSSGIMNVLLGSGAAIAGKNITTRNGQ